METDDISTAEGKGGRAGEPVATTDDMETTEEGSGSDEAVAPSELARSLNANLNLKPEY
jgi:hypothetical protein